MFVPNERLFFEYSFSTNKLSPNISKDVSFSFTTKNFVQKNSFSIISTC